LRTIIITFISLIIFSGTIYSQKTYNKPVTSPIVKLEKTRSSAPVGSKTFTATAYSLRGRMSNGKHVFSGAIAADPKVLPLGTKVYIEGYGNFVVCDTGGAIKGSRIDIWMPNRNHAIKFGRRKVQLVVLK
jgi:3D (Asp-Asp-Asp) domain-containing protein